MTAEEARRLDDACVWMMERTSWRSPIDFLLDCAGCGLPFWARHDTTRYCGHDCYARSYYRRHAAFRARQNARRCASARAAVRPRVTRNCAECGAAFVALTRRHVYCTARCRNRITTRRYYWRHHQRTERAA